MERWSVRKQGREGRVGLTGETPESFAGLFSGKSSGKWL